MTSLKPAGCHLLTVSICMSQLRYKVHILGKQPPTSGQGNIRESGPPLPVSDYASPNKSKRIGLTRTDVLQQHPL